jgi:hypothetical protein
MSLTRKHVAAIAVAAGCAVAGAGASMIASAGAASTSAATSPTASKTPNARKAAGKHRGFTVQRALRGTVHGVFVVRTSTGFATATLDRGFVQSVSGQQLTIREGTKRATYKTITLSIPSAAVVRDNRQKATLAQLKPGQHVSVLQAPKRTVITARDVK